MIHFPLWFQMANLSYFPASSNRASINCRNGSSSTANSTLLCNSSFITNSTIGVPDLSHGDIAEMTVLAFICIVSLVANGVLFFAIRRGRKNDKDSPGSKLLLNVTSINILLTVLVLPWNICFLAMTYSPISTAWYKFYYMITITFEVLTKTTWLLVAVISFDRYCAIVRSSYPRMLPKKKIKQLPFWLFVSTVVLIALPVTVLCEVEYDENRHFYAVRRHTWKFFAFDLLYFLLPFGTMCFCWGKIFTLAWSKKLKVYLGKVDPPTELSSQIGTAETSVTDSKHLGMVHFMGLGRLSRSNSRESMSSTDSSTHAPGSRKTSIATTVVYNKSLKAVRTVCIIMGSFLLTVGTYTVSVLLEPFEVFGRR
ncbi:hypothetical protein RvY_01153-2 [Ramazzottius varieornatus]|nr:hypothetical protein RvY_01153-2 [Ramazzottius varieornatus]